MLDHRFHLHRAHDVVVEGDCSVGRTVAVNQSVEDVVVQMISSGCQGISQLISIQLVGSIFIVQLENGLENNSMLTKPS